VNSTRENASKKFLKILQRLSKIAFDTFEAIEDKPEFLGALTSLNLINMLEVLCISQDTSLEGTPKSHTNFMGKSYTGLIFSELSTREVEYWTRGHCARILELVINYRLQMGTDFSSKIKKNQKLLDNDDYNTVYLIIFAFEQSGESLYPIDMQLLYYYTRTIDCLPAVRDISFHDLLRCTRLFQFFFNKKNGRIQQNLLRRKSALLIEEIKSYVEKGGPVTGIELMEMSTILIPFLNVPDF
jgi:hypothetical protein